MSTPCQGAGKVGQESLVSLLRALVSAGEYGPLITLCGEADITTAARLSELVTVKLSGETRHLSMDAAELAYADSMAIHVLLMAANTLKERGGSLVLLRPQGPVARMLELIGVTQLLTIRGETEPEPKL
jgi:anti-anti-sigma factor